MTRIASVGLALIALTVSMATAEADPAETSKDAQEIKSVVRSFFSALGQEDVEAASKLVLHPEKLLPWINSQAELSAAFDRWNKVVEKAFGAQAKPLVMPNPIRGSVEKCESVEAVVNGTTAVFPIMKQNPLKLKYENDRWMLDIYAAYELPVVEKSLGVKGEPALQLITLMAHENTRMLHSIADAIEAGELTSGEEIRAQIGTERDTIAQKFSDAIHKAKAQQIQD